jgi:hypothetical protein
MLSQIINRNSNSEEFETLFGSLDKVEKTIDTMDRLHESYASLHSYLLPGFAEDQEKIRASFMNSCYRWSRDYRPSMPYCVEKGFDRLDQVLKDESNSVYQAAMLAALYAEQVEVKNGNTQNPYHNIVHFIQTSAIVSLLVQAHNHFQQYDHSFPELNTGELALVLLAMTGHDLDHPGRKNPPEDPLKNEKRSLRVLGNIMEMTGVAESDRKKVEVMILATSPDGPRQILEKAIRISGEGRKPEISEIDPGHSFPELHALAEDPSLIEMCAIICDSDIAASVYGLMSHWKTSWLLQEELKQAGEDIDLMSPASTMFFLDNIVGSGGMCSLAGRMVLNGSFHDLRICIKPLAGCPEPN